MTRTKCMAKDNRNTLTPKLRFPQFRNHPMWDTKLGGELFDQTNNRGASAGLPVLAITQEHGAIPRDEIDYHVSVTDKSIETYKEVLPGDFIISLRSFQGGIEYSKYHGICSPAYVVLRKKAEISDAFYKYLFKSHGFIQQLTKNLEGIRDGKMISYKQFSELRLPCPSSSEQRKIAECLSTLDELIEAESRKLDALKDHKKGLMQQLFPREGETRPRLRFPEFQSNDEWRTVPLSELLREKPVYGANAPAVPYSETLPTYLRITDIDDDGRFIRANKVSVAIIPSEDNFLRLGDIVLARTGASVGKSYQYKETDGDLVFAGFLIRLRPHPEKVVSTYLFNFLRTDRYWNWVRITSARSGQPGINSAEYSALPIPMPPDGDIGLAEQQRIADCLSSVDDLIAVQSDKLEALRTHKRGLMQQLLPNPSVFES